MLIFPTGVLWISIAFQGGDYTAQRLHRLLSGHFHPHPPSQQKPPRLCTVQGECRWARSGYSVFSLLGFNKFVVKNQLSSRLYRQRSIWEAKVGSDKKQPLTWYNLIAQHERLCIRRWGKIIFVLTHCLNPHRTISTSSAPPD